MSSKPAQSISLERVASRRNVIRAAAWTTAAVTVVVATPNIAAASHGAAPSATIDGTRKAGVGKNDPDQYTLTAAVNAGSHGLSVLQVTLSVDAGSVSWPENVTGGWTRDGGTSNAATTSRSYTYSGGNLSANTAATIGVPAFTNPSSAKNVTITAVFSWTGGSAGSPLAVSKVLARA